MLLKYELYSRPFSLNTPLLDYARTVEALTTGKKENLILNVDGTIEILMLDILYDI